MNTTRKYSPEVRERAVRLVSEHAGDHDSQRAAIRSISEKIGCTAETLRTCVRQRERDEGRRPGRRIPHRRSSSPIQVRASRVLPAGARRVYAEELTNREKVATGAP